VVSRWRFSNPAAEERQAAENAVVVTNRFIEIFIASLIPRFESETSILLSPARGDEVFAHANRAAARNATAALDAAIELTNLFGQLGSIFPPGE